MAEHPPAMHVSARPLAAHWLQRHGLGRQVRQAAELARVQGRALLAEELEDLSAQLRLVATLWGEASVDGSAEAVLAEIEPESGVSSLDSTVVAGLLGVSARRVRMLCDDGTLSATRLGRVWQIDRGSVDEYLIYRRTS